MSFPWIEILSAEQIEAHHAATAELDPAFARDQRAFYLSRTPADLRALVAQAWQCNEAEAYQMARSYLAMLENSPAERRARLDAAIQKVQERRLKRRPPQEFDTSALPLFGDQRHQAELF